MDRDSLHDQGILPFGSQRPTLGPSDQIGFSQLMTMLIFSLLQCFQHGSLLTLRGYRTVMHFGELHLEHPREDLGFLGSPEALQLQGLLVILLI